MFGYNYQASSPWHFQPDPLMDALESVIGDGTSLGGKLEATQADVEVLNFSIFC